MIKLIYTSLRSLKKKRSNYLYKSDVLSLVHLLLWGVFIVLIPFDSPYASSISKIKMTDLNDRE